MFVVFRIVLSISSIGNGDGIVLAAANRRVFLLLISTNHGERCSTDQNRLADWIFTGKQALDHVIADHDHIFTVQVFGVRIETSTGNSKGIDIGKIGGRSRVVNVGEFVTLIARRADWPRTLPCARKNLDAHVLYRQYFLFDGHPVFVGQRLAHALLGTEPAHMKTNIETKDPEVIYAEFTE